MTKVQLNIGNSFSRISGLNDKQFQLLRKTLSYKLDYAASYYIKDPTKRVKYCIDLKGTFPSGLLPRVIKFLSTSEYTIIDTRIEPNKLTTSFKLDLKTIVPYSEQLEAVGTLLIKGSGGCVMPTGSGKSITMALLINSMQLRTLIVVPNLELKKQLTETFIKLFGSLNNIIIENIDSTNLQKITDIDMLILDECHRSAASTYQKLNKKQWVNAYHRFFFSATYFRNEDNEQLIFEGICGEPTYTLSYEDAVNAKMVVPVEAYYLEIPKSKPKGNTYAEIYSELVVNNDSRNLIIATLLSRLWSVDKSVLCLVKEINHGKIIRELTGTPFSSGADESSREFIKDFSSGRFKALIATTGMCGEGIDTVKCEYVIIAGLGKAKSALLQQIGRAVRTAQGKTSAKVIIIKDDSHLWTKRHFKEQCKIIFDYYSIDTVRLSL